MEENKEMTKEMEPEVIYPYLVEAEEIRPEIIHVQNWIDNEIEKIKQGNAALMKKYPMTIMHGFGPNPAAFDVYLMNERTITTMLEMKKKMGAFLDDKHVL